MPASEYTRCSFFPPTLKQGRKEGTGETKRGKGGKAEKEGMAKNSG